jgi:hypothetical protein
VGGFSVTTWSIDVGGSLLLSEHLLSRVFRGLGGEVWCGLAQRARAPPKFLPCAAGRGAPHSLGRFCSQAQKTKALNVFFAYVYSDDAKTASFLSPAFRPCAGEKSNSRWAPAGRKKVFFALGRRGLLHSWPAPCGVLRHTYCFDFARKGTKRKPLESSMSMSCRHRCKFICTDGGDA